MVDDLKSFKSPFGMFQNFEDQLAGLCQNDTVVNLTITQQRSDFAICLFTATSFHDE